MVATIEVPAGEHFWVGVIEDVTLDVAERQHRQRMEAAFAELSFALNDADAAEVDAALDHGLCLLGELVGADRSYVFRLHGAGLLSNTHEWCAPGVEPAITMLQGLPVAEFSWVMGRLAGSPQVLSVVDLPPRRRQSQGVPRGAGHQFACPGAHPPSAASSSGSWGSIP